MYRSLVEPSSRSGLYRNYENSLALPSSTPQPSQPTDLVVTAKVILKKNEVLRITKLLLFFDTTRTA
jgi:hypothetical protein